MCARSQTSGLHERVDLALEVGVGQVRHQRERPLAGVPQGLLRVAHRVAHTHGSQHHTLGGDSPRVVTPGPSMAHGRPPSDAPSHAQGNLRRAGRPLERPPSQDRHPRLAGLRRRLRRRRPARRDEELHAGHAGGRLRSRRDAVLRPLPEVRRRERPRPGSPGRAPSATRRSAAPSPTSSAPCRARRAWPRSRRPTPAATPTRSRRTGARRS